MNFNDLGFLAIERGDYQEAINLFRRRMEKHVDSSCFLGLGISHFLLDDRDTARWAFHKTLERDPKNKEAIRYLAKLEKRKKEGGKKEIPGRQRESTFRAHSDYLEVKRERWEKLFLKGINIGIGLPGRFPNSASMRSGSTRSILPFSTRRSRSGTGQARHCISFRGYGRNSPEKTAISTDNTCLISGKISEMRSMSSTAMPNFRKNRAPPMANTSRSLTP